MPRNAEELKAALHALQNEGLTFGQCVEVFGVSRDQNPYAKAAHEQFHRDGECEIDTTTVVSGSGDAGDYVMAWVWVDDEDVVINGLSYAELVKCYENARDGQAAVEALCAKHGLTARAHCEPCEDDTPSFGSICAVCGTPRESKEQPNG